MSKPGPASYLFTLLTAFLLGAAIYGITQLRQLSVPTQDKKYDLAHLQDARYGVLNVHEWKRQVSDIISVKIEEFEIDPTNAGKLQGQIENALYKLIDELEKFLKQEEQKGSVFEKMLKSVAYNVAFDADKFKQQVPAWSVQILDEINNDETRAELKDYIGEKIEELLQITSDPENTVMLDSLTTKYDCVDRDSCINQLQKDLRTSRVQTWNWGGFTAGAVLLVFLLFMLSGSYRQLGLSYFLLIVGCVILLYGGLSLPMIDIDARISDLSFNLMGEAMTFSDQVLFFQSKSILEVVRLLLEQGDFQTYGVGVLILLFSVVFPLLKMLSSAWVVARPRLLRHSSLLNWLVLKSGKWSMADVFVVAIFMAYIGFKGIINSQLSQLERSNPSVNMITTHEFTALQVGFLMFTGFCLASLLFSTLLDLRRVRGDAQTA